MLYKFYTISLKKRGIAAMAAVRWQKDILWNKKIPGKQNVYMIGYFFFASIKITLPLYLQSLMSCQANVGTCSGTFLKLSPTQLTE